MTACSRALHMKEPECAICLGTSEHCAERAVLHCGHAYCRPCIAEHVAVRQSAGLKVLCPSCNEALQSEEAIATGAEKMMQAQQATASLHVSPSASPADHVAFIEYARHLHLRYCPHCGAMIVKDGGCDHMVCFCGRHFSWSSARVVARCRQLHLHPQISCWCSICPGCSPVAIAKLIFVRSCIVCVACALSWAIWKVLCCALWMLLNLAFAVLQGPVELLIAVGQGWMNLCTAFAEVHVPMLLVLCSLVFSVCLRRYKAMLRKSAARRRLKRKLR